MDRNQVAVQAMIPMVIVTNACMSTLQMRCNTFAQMLRSRRRFFMMTEMSTLRRRRRRTQEKRIMSLVPNPRPRRVQRHTSTHWWDTTVPQFSDIEWMDNFRIHKDTFNWLCNELGEALEPRPNPVPRRRAPLPVEKIVAIALYKLSHLAEYLAVANLFGVCKTTVHNCLYAFCDVIVDVLGERFIFFPDCDESEEIAKCFEETTNIPQLIGAIDGSHIPITPPLEGHSDFINRKLYPSIILQAIVDHKYRFRNISCVLPGANHDVDALKESEFYVNRAKYIPAGSRNVDGMNIPFMIMGDPAYRLTDWLIKSYPYDKNITRSMDSFNAYLNKGRVVVENAFGRLKSRWRILSRQSDIYYKFMPKVVAACCILHNICEDSKQEFRQSWMQAFCEDVRLFPQPADVNYDIENQYNACDIRDHLMLFLSRTYQTFISSRGACCGLDS